MSEERGQVRCGCGLPAWKRTSWTERNPGRRFLSCQLREADTDSKGCDFFKWLDDGITEWQRHLTNKLILEKKLLEVQLTNCQAEVKELQSQRSLLLHENENLKIKCKAVTAELKLKKKKGSISCLNSGRILGSMKFWCMIFILVCVAFGVVVMVI